jgi:hypothetical protein
MIKSILLIINIILVIIILLLIYIKFTDTSKKNRIIMDDGEIFLLNILNYISANDTREHNINDKYIVPDINLKYSNKIKSRGVFANKDYKKGDILEICPAIKFGHRIDDSIPLSNYGFNINNNYNILAFGYCSLYNHSDTPNAHWSIINENQIQITILNDIKKNEEIFVHYGETYWESRKSKYV